jgi:hypothetical protein
MNNLLIIDLTGRRHGNAMVSTLEKPVCKNAKIVANL